VDILSPFTRFYAAFTAGLPLLPGSNPYDPRLADTPITSELKARHEALMTAYVVVLQRAPNVCRKPSDAAIDYPPTADGKLLKRLERWNLRYEVRLLVNGHVRSRLEELARRYSELAVSATRRRDREWLQSAADTCGSGAAALRSVTLPRVGGIVVGFLVSPLVLGYLGEELDANTSRAGVIAVIGGSLLAEVILFLALFIRTSFHAKRALICIRTADGRTVYDLENRLWVELRRPKTQERQLDLEMVRWPSWAAFVLGGLCLGLHTPLLDPLWVKTSIVMGAFVAFGIGVTFTSETMQARLDAGQV
jgi:hypothetical protein